MLLLKVVYHIKLKQRPKKPTLELDGWVFLVPFHPSSLLVSNLAVHPMYLVIAVRFLFQNCPKRIVDFDTSVSRFFLLEKDKKQTHSYRDQTNAIANALKKTAENSSQIYNLQPSQKGLDKKKCSKPPFSDNCSHRGQCWPTPDGAPIMPAGSPGQVNLKFQQVPGEKTSKWVPELYYPITMHYYYTILCYFFNYVFGCS